MLSGTVLGRGVVAAATREVDEGGGESGFGAELDGFGGPSRPKILPPKTS